MKASIIYITDGKLDPRIRDFCFNSLKDKAQGHQIIKVENEPDAPRKIKTIYENILVGLDAAKYKLVFIAEHDVLYPPGYFDLKNRPDISYTKNVVYLDKNGIYRRELPNAPLSTLAGDRDLIREAIISKMTKKKLSWLEPGVEDIYSDKVTYRECVKDVIDIRHGSNFTGSRIPKKYLSEEAYPLLRIRLFGGEIPETKSAPQEEGQMNPDEIPDEVKKLIDEANATNIGHLKETLLMDAVDKLQNPENKKQRNAAEVTCIITSKNEELLPWTIANIQRTAPEALISVIFDGWQVTPELPDGVHSYMLTGPSRGVGPARDYGIMQAETEYVVILDAHMDFNPGWLDALLDPVRMDPKVISCSRSAVLGTKSLDISKAKKVYTAAWINWINKINMPFDPIWKDHKPLEEVQCVLGACYCFRRDRYIKDLFRPWANAVGWGSSEQVLSVVNWFLGGKQILADCTTGHLYRTPKETVPFRYSLLGLPGMFYNRCRLIDLLPISFERKKILVDCCLNRKELTGRRASGHKQTFLDNIRDWIDLRPDDELKAAILASSRSWDDYVSRFYPSGITWPMAKAKKKPRSTPKPKKGRTGRNRLDLQNPPHDSRFI